MNFPNKASIWAKTNEVPNFNQQILYPTTESLLKQLQFTVTQRICLL